MKKAVLDFNYAARDPDVFHFYLVKKGFTDAANIKILLPHAIQTSEHSLIPSCVKNWFSPPKEVTYTDVGFNADLPISANPQAVISYHITSILLQVICMIHKLEPSSLGPMWGSYLGMKIWW